MLWRARRVPPQPVNATQGRRLSLAAFSCKGLLSFSDNRLLSVEKLHRHTNTHTHKTPESGCSAADDQQEDRPCGKKMVTSHCQGEGGEDGCSNSSLPPAGTYISYILLLPSAVHKSQVCDWEFSTKLVCCSQGENNNKDKIKN